MTDNRPVRRTVLVTEQARQMIERIGGEKERRKSSWYIMSDYRENNGDTKAEDKEHSGDTKIYDRGIGWDTMSQ